MGYLIGIQLIVSLGYLLIFLLVPNMSWDANKQHVTFVVGWACLTCSLLLLGVR